MAEAEMLSTNEQLAHEPGSRNEPTTRKPSSQRS
jgi:hypothetical protein